MKKYFVAAMISMVSFFSVATEVKVIGWKEKQDDKLVTYQISNTGNKDGVLLVPQSNAVCEFKIPQAKKALPVYWDGWNWVTKYKLDCSGLHLYLPKKIGYTSY